MFRSWDQSLGIYVWGLGSGGGEFQGAGRWGLRVDARVGLVMALGLGLRVIRFDKLLGCRVQVLGRAWGTGPISFAQHLLQQGGLGMAARIYKFEAPGS